MTTLLDGGHVADDFRRDRWDRPLIPPPGGGPAVAYPRASSIGKTIEDTYNLERWARRNIAYGMSHDPSLVAKVLALPGEPKTWGKVEKDAVNAIWEAAEGVAKAHARADIGTALHTMTERLDRGESFDAGIYQPDLDAYRAVIGAAGLEVHPDYIECRIVCDSPPAAGTADRIVMHKASGRWRIADLKTSASVEYGGLGWAAQLAVYAHGTLYDVATDQRLQTPPMDTETGYIIHLPAGEGVCTIYEIDLELGYEAAVLATDVKRMRGLGNDALRPYVSAGAPPPATDGTVDAWQRRHAELLARYRGLVDADQRRYLTMATAIDPTDLDAVEALLDAVDPFNQPNTPPPVDGWTRAILAPNDPPPAPQPEAEPNPGHLAAVTAMIEALPPHHRDLMNALAAAAHDAGHGLSLRIEPTHRKVIIAEALARWVTFGWDGDVQRDILGWVAGGERIAEGVHLGAVIGALSHAAATKWLNLIADLDVNRCALQYGADGWRPLYHGATT